MPRLGLTHRLLLLWFGSALAVLLVSGVAMRWLHERELQQERQARIQSALEVVHSQMSERASALQNSATALAQRRSVVSTLNLLGDYFVPGADNAALFDPALRDLSAELADLARAVGANWAAVQFPHGLVSAYWEEERKGLNAGVERRVYFSYAPEAILSSIELTNSPAFFSPGQLALPPALQRDLNGGPGVSLRGCRLHNADQLALVARAPVVSPRDASSLGLVVLAHCLDETFVEQVAGRAGVGFAIGNTAQMRSSNMPSPPGLALRTEPVSVPVIVSDPALLPSRLRWLDDDSHLFARAEWVLDDGESIGAYFALARDTEELGERVLIWAGLFGLGLSVVLIFVLGFFYLRHAVTRPLERLARGVTRVLEGRYEPITDVNESDDELGVLAKTLNRMTVEIREREEALRRLSMAVEQSPASVVITNPEGIIEYTNRRFTELSGYSAEEVLGKKPGFLRSGKVKHEVYVEMWRTIASGEVWRGELINRTKQGDLVCEQTSISPIVDASGTITHYVAVKEDITEQRQTEARIEHLAFHDPLTDLPNRRLFRDRLDQALRHYERYGHSFALMLLDLDHFKDINDSLGHSVGDDLLRLVAIRLRSLLRDSDTLARLGGDEFAIVQVNLHTPHDAAALAEKVIASFRDPFLTGAMRLHSNTSIGIMVAAADVGDADEFVSRADIALYKAKDGGRGNFVFYDENMTRQVQEDADLTHELARAVESGQLSLMYQPQIQLSDLRFVGVESLLRWAHPRLGQISPVRFIPLAESRGLMPEIGQWVMVESCRQWLAWREAGLIVPRIAVNVSALQFKGGRGFDALLDTIRSSGVPPDALEIEFTESAFVDVGEATLDWMERVRELGIHFAIDDFGTGYSSLIMLRRLAAHKLKVDREFVKDMLEDASDEAIVRATVSLAQSLGMRVVAEGIETAPQAEFLRSIGCDIGQGYYFARPLPPEEILQRYGKVEDPVDFQGA